MKKHLAAAAAAVLVVSAVSSTADAGGGPHRRHTPGAAGIGDPYFPLAGNGGYDVLHYDLEVKYDPTSDVLTGQATIKARATQDLSSFNLDLDGLNVRRIKLDGKSASFSRTGGELTVVTRRGIDKRDRFEVVVNYEGIPETLFDLFGTSGFVHTDDGAVVIGQPRVASTWYPVNDHPLDTASYDFSITVPAGLEAIANGVLTSTRTRRGWTTWEWSAKEPMAPYLTTMAIGEFDVRAYRAGKLKFWDAVDPDLYAPPVTPPTGEQFALTEQGTDSFRRLALTFTVPEQPDQLMTFSVSRDTEPFWDYFFVEAHHPGQDDWTTLPEATGKTEPDGGSPCEFLLPVIPFLAHYVTPGEEPGSCEASGSTGDWHAASGSSGGFEQWTIDLSAFSGEEIEIVLSYASDYAAELAGVFVDDIDVPGDLGDTSFEDDGDTTDGWELQSAPDGVPGTWLIGGAELGPPPAGVFIDHAFSQQADMIDFLAGFFGGYPFSAAGGIVDDADGINFALETQTRPVYGKVFFTNPIDAELVVVHEYAHQWFGDDLPLARWQDIWLNEGFATYAEWLWLEHIGLSSPDQEFDLRMQFIPEDDPFWSLVIGDPGPLALFDLPVYWRGGMTLHALRREVGDDAFFTIVHTWATSMAGQNVSTDQFISLAEEISGQDLDELFDTWLFTAAKPPAGDSMGAMSRMALTPTKSPLDQLRGGVGRK